MGDPMIYNPSLTAEAVTTNKMGVPLLHYIPYITFP